MLDYAIKKDWSYIVVLNMWADDDWGQTTLKKKLGQTTQDIMVHKG